MKACNCILPYVNPGACKNCSNNIEYPGFTYISHEDTKDTNTNFPIFISKKRIIKEYDKEGKLTKEIIEDIT